MTVRSEEDQFVAGGAAVTKQEICSERNHISKIEVQPQALASVGKVEDAIRTNPEASCERQRVLARVQEMGFDLHGLDECVIQHLMGNRLA